MKQSKKKEPRLKVFQERFELLRKERNLSNTDFAAFLGMSRQTVGFYLNGNRIPDALTLIRIAEKCGVSSDYLLGLTDIRTPNIEIKSIAEQTGLSEELVAYILDIKDVSFGKNGEYSRFLSELFASYRAETSLMLYGLFKYKSALQATCLLDQLSDEFWKEELKKRDLPEDADSDDDLIYDTVSARLIEESKKIQTSSQYSPAVKNFVTAETFIRAELIAKDNPFRSALNGIPDDLIISVYKNDVISMLNTLLTDIEKETKSSANLQ